MDLGEPHEPSVRKRVLIAVVTFNNEQDILECTDTLLRQSGVEIEIVVVDNGSSDRTVGLLRENSVNVKIVQNTMNIGYPGGLNQVLKCGVPEYFLALNADTSSPSDWLSRAIQELEKSAQAGICQPKILLYDRKTALNSRGNQANFLFFGWPEGYGEADDADEESRIIPFPSGCAMLCKRECVQLLRGFDDSYFMYGEDVDFGLRAFICGWDTTYSPGAVVYHKYRFKVSPAKFYLLERNRMITLLKIYRTRTLFAMLPALVATELGVISKARRENWLAEKIRSYGHVVKRAPSIKSQRSEVQRLRVRSDSDLLRRLRGGMDFPSIQESGSYMIGNKFLEKYHQFLLNMRL